MHIPPYGVVKMEPGRSIAFLNGDIPWVILRTGSDAVKMPVGACYVVDANLIQVCNPFPFPAEITIGRGYAPAAALEGGITVAQAQNIWSMSGSHYRAATVTGQKWAIGTMLKRGAASMQVYDFIGDGFTKIMTFPAARVDFMAFKPAGCMEDVTTYRRMDGTYDNHVVSVSGLYTDAHVAAWVAAAGYDAARITESKHLSVVNQLAQWRVADDTAVFVVRDIDKAVGITTRVSHLGLPVSDFT